MRADSFRNIAAPSGKAPVPALSATVSFVYHFFALMSHTSTVVSYYACGFLRCLLACLRVRDAQRASVHCSDDMVEGCCFTSKHPKHRHAKRMPFYVPAALPFESTPCRWALRLHTTGQTCDYVFPRVKVPRGTALSSHQATLMAGPAPL